MICTVLLSNKKYRSPCSFKKKNIYFAIELSLRGNFFRCVCAQAHLRPNDAKKNGAVGMRYAILSNHLKLWGRQNFGFQPNKRVQYPYEQGVEKPLRNLQKTSLWEQGIL